MYTLQHSVLCNKMLKNALHINHVDIAQPGPRAFQCYLSFNVIQQFGRGRGEALQPCDVIQLANPQRQLQPAEKRPQVQADYLLHIQGYLFTHALICIHHHTINLATYDKQKFDKGFILHGEILKCLRQDKKDCNNNTTCEYACFSILHINYHETRAVWLVLNRMTSILNHMIVLSPSTYMVQLGDINTFMQTWAQCHGPQGSIDSKKKNTSLLP